MEVDNHLAVEVEAVDMVEALMAEIMLVEVVDIFREVEIQWVAVEDMDEEEMQVKMVALLLVEELVTHMEDKESASFNIMK